MSMIASRELVNPVNKTDSCPVFVIDRKQTVFAFNNVTVVGNEYTVSFWAKTDVDRVISVNGKAVTIGTNWVRHDFTYTATSTDLFFDFKTEGNYYIYQLQLELGNRATDWTPAPEDAEERIDNIKVGGRNLVRNSANLIFDKYYFSGVFHTSYDGVGNLTVTSGASASHDNDGNVTLRTSATAAHDGNGNVTIS